jgi:K+/H+ antiporter YhaU regulatory subunit KhtT
MPSPRRFPPPWSVEEHEESFIVKDANGQALTYLYFEDEPQRQMSMKRLSRDEARRIAANIGKLPRVPRQILIEIPRPPNTASRDD